MELSSSGESGPSPEGQDQLYAVVRATLASEAAATNAPAINEARERLSARVAREGNVGRIGKIGSSELLNTPLSTPQGVWLWHRSPSGSHVLPRGLWFAGAGATILLAYVLARPTSSSSTEATTTYATNAGQQATVTLNDSTQVILAPHTTLRVARFDAQTRRVLLDGEAYFTVARASGAPFLVRTGTMTTRVLGTSFLVRHDVGDARIRVAVASGKVLVTAQSHPDSGVTLASGQIGEITDSTAHVSAIDDIAPGTEWVNDHLLFHDTPVETVLAALTRWYGYQFHCTDPMLLRKSVTIMVNVRSSSAALAKLEQILGVNLTVVGDTVTLIPQSVQSPKSTPRVRGYDVWTPTKEVGR